MASVCLARTCLRILLRMSLLSSFRLSSCPRPLPAISFLSATYWSNSSSLALMLRAVGCWHCLAISEICLTTVSYWSLAVWTSPRSLFSRLMFNIFSSRSRAYSSRSVGAHPVCGFKGFHARFRRFLPIISFALTARWSEFMSKKFPASESLSRYYIIHIYIYTSVIY